MLPRAILNLSLLASAILLSACGLSIQPLMPTPLVFTESEVGPLDHIPQAERFKPRRVYYATTRKRDDDFQRIDYGNGEGDQVSVGLALVGFGGPDVSWSDLHRYSRQRERERVVDLNLSGVIEAGSFDPADDRPDSSESAVSWLLADLNDSIESARDKDLLIYVHGAKVNFYNACAFAAQLDHFMGRDMTSLAFAWPTRQNIFAYASGGDVRRAYRHAHALTTLLERLATRTKARRIHIVAWSAGGRVVTEALSELHDRHAKGTPSLRNRFRIGTVYLAAADVPGDEFIAAIPKLDALANRVVVTASDNDGALKSSSIFMGGDVRIGTVRDEPLPPEQAAIVRSAKRLEVIDVSRGSAQRGFDIDGHRYWFDHPWASSDLILAVRSDFGPAERALKKEGHPVLWSLPADYPERLRKRLSRPGVKLRRN
jgi:esterase/lipase superfamily enzyme